VVASISDKIAVLVVLLVALYVPQPGSSAVSAKRVIPRAWLNMPQRSSGAMPALLSKTGAFADTRTLKPAPGLMPYELIQPFWSDGAGKQRWAAIPAGKIGFRPTGQWQFPPGTVFVKTFELPLDVTRPQLMRRLETRLLVVDSDGAVYGVVYKWRADNSDADLLGASQEEAIPSTGQTWYYPSRQDCLECHNSRTNGVLGVTTRQMNRDFKYPSGIAGNQLRVWNGLGMFQPTFTESELKTFPALAAMDDVARNIEDRARSYLDANCSQCHRPGGTVAYFDARFDTALPQQELVDGNVLIDQGIDRPRVISPHDIWRSIAYMRINTNGDIRMPPLARETIDQRGVALLGQWIDSMPGRDVVAPPTITPSGGTYDHPVDVTLEDSDRDAEIRYTLDGSVPSTSDMRYDQPIKLIGPTVLRARAFKPGSTRSITAQEAFVVGSP
jgi:uncharacterized repeat protein (TIGR03806 family)